MPFAIIDGINTRYEVIGEGPVPKRSEVNDERSPYQTTTGDCPLAV